MAGTRAPTSTRRVRRRQPGLAAAAGIDCPADAVFLPADAQRRPGRAAGDRRTRSASSSATPATRSGATPRSSTRPTRAGPASSWWCACGASRQLRLRVRLGVRRRGRDRDPRRRHRHRRAQGRAHAAHGRPDGRRGHRATARWSPPASSRSTTTTSSFPPRPRRRRPEQQPAAGHYTGRRCSRTCPGAASSLLPRIPETERWRPRSASHSATHCQVAGAQREARPTASATRSATSCTTPTCPAAAGRGGLADRARGLPRAGPVGHALRSGRALRRRRLHVRSKATDGLAVWTEAGPADPEPDLVSGSTWACTTCPRRGHAGDADHVARVQAAPVQLPRPRTRRSTCARSSPAANRSPAYPPASRPRSGDSACACASKPSYLAGAGGVARQLRVALWR